MSEKTSETWLTRPGRPLKRGQLDACLIHIYPTGLTMGRRYPLGALPTVVGRVEECDIRLRDNSVSRRHARIEPVSDGYVVSDLGSTNGTFVNDVPVVHSQLLTDGDYLRVGNCIYRFLAGGNVEAEYHEEIYRLTIIDGLTQVHNKRYLLEFLDRELARSVRHRRPLALVMIDLDLFKDVNDVHGHLCGDHVLRELSERVRHTVRREDLFARYGGEEFVLVLVETQLQQAVEAGERVRAAVAERPFEFEGTSLNLSVSVGVTATDGEAGLTLEELIRRADTNLYAAKRSGRNRVQA